jgi:enterochelin esterase-like enzyme
VNVGAPHVQALSTPGIGVHLELLVEEFLPLLVKRLGKLPVVLYGFSMGGYGALLASERGAAAGGENLFRAVAVASPALWTEPGDTAPGAFDSPSDVYSNHLFRSVQLLRSLPVRLDCGDEDPFYAATREFSALMTWPHQAVYRPGAGHTWGYWRSVALSQMRFLARACDLVCADLHYLKCSGSIAPVMPSQCSVWTQPHRDARST